MRWHLALPLCVLLSAALGFTVHDADAQSGTDPVLLTQALRKTQTMLQKLVQENEKMRTAQREAERELGELRKDAARADALEPALKAAEQRGGALQSRNEELLARVKRNATRLRDARQTQAAQQREIDELRHDNALLVAAVQEREYWIGEATRRNRELVTVNQELLQPRADRGLWNAFKRAEPLTQLGRVEEESRQQNYRHRLEDLRVTPWRPGAQPEPAP